MPIYLQSNNWLLLWPLLAITIFMSALFALTYRGTTARPHVFHATGAFGFLGIAAGYIAGYSREPAVGTVMPAILSLIGGLAVYVVGAKKADVRLVSLSVLALALNVVIGITWGAERRTEFEVYRNGAIWRSYEAEVEQYVIQSRRELGLSDYPPDASPKRGEGK